MKYTKDSTDKIVSEYLSGVSTIDIALNLTAELNTEVPDRSVIAKLASLGVYQKKAYLTKRGTLPVKKEEYITRIAKLLDVNAELLESLEKVNKGVLALLETALKQDHKLDPKLERDAALAELNYFTDPALTY